MRNIWPCFCVAFVSGIACASIGFVGGQVFVPPTAPFEAPPPAASQDDLRALDRMDIRMLRMELNDLRTRMELVEEKQK